jgi:hypothetical protein
MNNYQYQSLQQIVSSNKYPFTIGQLRHMLLHRHHNQLEKAVRKVGKRLYLRIDLWEAWLEKQMSGKTADHKSYDNDQK